MNMTEFKTPYENATQKLLQHCKFKKYNFLKHNPISATKPAAIDEDNPNSVKLSHAQVTVPSQDKINNKRGLYKLMEEFYRHMKLKAHF